MLSQIVIVLFESKSFLSKLCNIIKFKTINSKSKNFTQVTYCAQKNCNII